MRREKVIGGALLRSVSVNLAELRRVFKVKEARLRPVSVNLAELSPSPRLRRTRRRVLAWSSGAPGGGVAAVGADDVAGLSLREVGAAGLNGGAFVAKEERACLGGEAARARIGVAILSVDPAWGDKVVSAPINITFRSHG